MQNQGLNPQGSQNISENNGLAIAATPDNKDSRNDPKKNANCDCFDLLIVDDEIFNLIILQNMFKDRYVCEKAANGRIGLTKLMSKCSCGKMYFERCELIITDINMPEMNGYEFAQELRRLMGTKELPQTMIIGNTANRIEQTKNYQCFNYMFSKPFKKETMLELAEKYIGVTRKARQGLYENVIGNTLTMPNNDKN